MLISHPWTSDGGLRVLMHFLVRTHLRPMLGLGALLSFHFLTTDYLWFIIFMMMNQATPNPSEPVHSGKRGSHDCDIHHITNLSTLQRGLLANHLSSFNTKVGYQSDFNQTERYIYTQFFIHPGSSNFYNGSQTLRYTLLTIFSHSANSFARKASPFRGCPGRYVQGWTKIARIPQ